MALAIRIVDADDAVVPAMVRLMADAYPAVGITSADALEKYVERARAAYADAGTRFVVAEENGTLVGAMRLFDYTMNVRGTDASAGGVGTVAVSLAHKRRGIARALIAWYLDFYRERNAPFAILHPFRPDFYRALGFGYGTPVHRYGMRPAALRCDGARGTARLLEEADLDALLACSERVRRVTNGGVARHRAPLRRALGDVSVRHVGIEDGGELRGFMQTEVTLGPKGTQNRNRLTARDLFYEEPAHLAALLAYLRSQQDQFAEILFESQDAAFYLAAAGDPRDGSDRIVAPPGAHRIAETALGMMYRIVHLDGAFAHLAPSRSPFVLRVEHDDPFHAPTAGTTTYRFGPEGPPRRAHDAVPDATLRAGIADLSSLVVGSLSVRDAVRHRIASVEPSTALDAVSRVLHADQPPATTARF
jgi:predicted N-acetyltransferase YhbS